MPGAIHDEHPFADPEGVRDPIRRFRGRLASPVTIVTAYAGDDPVGLTVSSLLVAGDGEAGTLHFVIGADSYAWDAIGASGRFVVHILESSQRPLSDRFAGVRPSPGGPFTELEVLATPYGPALADCGTRAACTLEDHDDRGDHLVVAGRIESVTISDLTDPLQWFRGKYRRLAE